MSDAKNSTHPSWARLRLAIISRLLANPPPKGELTPEIRKLADQEWQHPVVGMPIRFGRSTIERWYHVAKRAQDPIAALSRRVRKDCGHRFAVSPRIADLLRAQHKAYPKWSYQLHHDNLLVQVETDAALGEPPSYHSVRRYMQGHGLLKRRSLGKTAAAQRAEKRVEELEILSFEVEHVHALWHTDGHEGSLKVLHPSGEWVKPTMIAILDDHSRLCCHLQWYWSESTQSLVHCLMQALQKRGLPRGLMSDNGSAMIAGEMVEGLAFLGIDAQRILERSPYQNGKQESFWGQVEGRLLAMLEGVERPTLELLNEASQAWAEQEYNRKIHSETHEAPLARLADHPSVGRDCPPTARLTLAFCLEETRIQRQSDGTVSILSKRFQIPSRFRFLQKVTVRYARWDLSRVFLWDPRARVVLAMLYPVDRAKNADGVRRRRDLERSPAAPPAAPGIAPLLKKLMADYAATGLPPAFIPSPPPTGSSSLAKPATARPSQSEEVLPASDTSEPKERP